MMMLFFGFTGVGISHFFGDYYQFLFNQVLMKLLVIIKVFLFLFRFPVSLEVVFGNLVGIGLSFTKAKKL